MEKLKKNLPLIMSCVSCVLLVIVIILLINVKSFKSNNVDSNNTNSNDTKEIKKNDEKKNDEIKEDIKEENNKEDVVVPTPTPTQEVKSEESVINYFQDIENSIKSSSVTDKVKEGFINTVDFIFYDKEIKGYTFKELTTSAKLKIITIALNIDKKIDTYFPNYKDKIKGTYTNIKDKLVEKYLEYTDKLCETVGSDVCDSAKENWEILKKNFGLTTDYLKNLGITGSEKIKNWYENFRENN